MAQTKTKEQIEYEKAVKNMHELSLKKALSEEGIDTSKIPRKTFDDFRRLVDSQSPVKQKYQEIITKAQQEAQAIITKAHAEITRAQQDANAIITKAQQDMQNELQEIEKGIEEGVKQIKIEQGIIQEEKPPEAEASPEGAEIEAGKEPEK